MNFKSLSDLLSGEGCSPIEQVDITGNMNAEEKLSEISKSMPTGSMYVKRIRTVDLTTADPHLGKKVWFMIGFQHTAAYGVQVFFQYSGDDIMIRKIYSTENIWVKLSGTRMD